MPSICWERSVFRRIGVPSAAKPSTTSATGGVELAARPAQQPERKLVGIDDEALVVEHECGCGQRVASTVR